MIACKADKLSTNNLSPTKVTSAKASEAEPDSINSDKKFGDPTRILILADELLEVSGLTYDPIQEQLIAINDEKGFIYYIDKENGTITDKLKFAGKGDYEGVEFVDGIVYIIKSNGDIFRFYPDNMKVDKRIETILSAVNDIEGLGYDASSKALLVACKGSPNAGKGTGNKLEKAVFLFDLKSEKLKKEALLTIKDEDLLKIFRTLNYSNYSKYKLKKLESRLTSFSPSAIAVHPHTGQYYILSSKGKLLLVISKNGSIDRIEFLNPDIHYQPEGICFTPEGHLYISNEGKNLKAKIFYYELK